MSERATAPPAALSPAAAVAGDASDRIDPRVWRISAVVMLGPLLTSLDSTVVNVSLSTLSRELHASLTDIQWVSSGYLLALALVLPVSGWLVDRVGARAVYLGCFTAFTLTSMMCGFARSSGSLIFFRVLQGSAGGLLAPMAQMMMARVGGRHLARIMGYSVVPVMIGPIAGPTMAGLILQYEGWRWTFLINLPIGILATVLAWRVLPRDHHERNPRAFDALGFALLSPGLVLALHSLERIATARAIRGWVGGELGLAIVLLAAFGAHARRRGRSALIDLSLFRGRTFSAAASTQFLQNAVSFGGQFLMPLYLLLVVGRSPGSTGMLLAPVGVGMLCSAPFMGTLTERFGPRRVASTGALIALAGTLPFAIVGAGHLPILVMGGALFLRGAGMGSVGIPSIAAAYAGMPRAQMPIATTALNIVQRIGGPIATTALAIVLYSGIEAHPASDKAPAFVVTFWVLCGLHLLCLVSASRLPMKAQPTPLSSSFSNRPRVA
jgi:EmrB/QacA subfamily drug resistance transporter